MHGRVGRHDLHRPARVRVHRPDVHLVPVVAGGGGPVVANRDRQEVEHQVGIRDVLVAAGEAPAFEVVRGARPAAEEQPPESDPRTPAPLEVRRHRDRLGAGVLHVDLQVVLEVLAHAGQVVHHVDAERAELVRVPHARHLEGLRRVEGAARQDHLAGVGSVLPSAAGVLHAHRAGPLEQDASDERAGVQLEVGSSLDRVQVRARRRQPAASVHVAVERTEPLLPVAVDVLGQVQPGLLDRLEERTEQRVVGGSPLQHQRARVAAVGVVEGRLHAVLHALEVGKAVRVVPRLHAGVGAPPLVVERIPALEDHPVDAARTAQHLAARVVDAPVVHVRLGLGLVLPVVEAAADRKRQRRRHVDEDVPGVIGAPRLQDQDAVGRVGGQTVGEGTASGPAADDDEVVLRPSHVVSAPCPGHVRRCYRFGGHALDP